MQLKDLNIVKKSGETVKFSSKKLQESLTHSGASDPLIKKILNKISAELYNGISTKEIFNRAFYYLKQEKGTFASKYKLKKAIYELGPSGFPFEKLISAVLSYSGYHTTVGTILQGKCVNHEIDIIGKKEEENIIVECKFHGDERLNCDVKIPLYIHSRFNDVKAYWDLNKKTKIDKGWVVTNTRFTKDAIKYGNCSGLFLLSWDFPPNNSLKDRIDRLGLYPITVSTLLSKKEKDFLLNRAVILCRQLAENSFYLNHLGVSEPRKKKILKEMSFICN